VSVRPKKQLGQHFLRDENIARKIAEALQVPPAMPVVEIGPGMGVLTKYLLPIFKDFRALDVDRDSVAYLREHYPEHAAKFHLEDFLHAPLPAGETAVIGNFPYNISSQIFFRVWEHCGQVPEVVCMIQKEVADRIRAVHGNKVYGILSVLLQADYAIEQLFTVGPGVFHPPPKVQSAVIRLVRRADRDTGYDRHLLKKVVKMAFGKRRKTLRNALKELPLPEGMLAEPLFDLRAEQLSVQDFIGLTKRLQNAGKS
jgi:16S rRNA (adenine1518-N6/adenine1519-N6)-dimethyltransferase